MTLLERLQQMPTQGVALAHTSSTGGFVRYRELNGVRSHLISAMGQNKYDLSPFVLLHGIGSGSGSWIEQLCDPHLGRVLAWDAPGYADSTPLPKNAPVAHDYAAQLWAWLDALQISEVHLVGHSLGCIMAASAARMYSGRIRSLTLLAPAQGYGSASAQVRQQKRDERLQAMKELGLKKMAEQRAPRLLSPNARPSQVELATHMMSHLNEGGYTQATQMLGHANIRADLTAFQSASTAPIGIACGDLDVITPPEACKALAEYIGVPYTSLASAGHVCALEAPQSVNQLLLSQGRFHE